ncbi:MAG: histidinol-phosphatase HisJ family protein [Actinomycetota bacterium]|nr:histidinol-phosphatase HisJ family protein [Actinomycetota bacterium]
MIVDYHMHLRDRHEEIALETWTVDPFVEAARAAGVDEIGFTEHGYYFKQLRPLWTVPYMTERCVHDIERYVEAVVTARGRGLPVKLGLEVDYVPGREEEARKLLATYPWDYLLGSVHFIGELSVDGEEGLLTDAVGVEEAWRLYFETLAGAARSGLFDSLSHPDLVKIFGVRAASFDYGPVADAIAGSGVAVEVSTAGLGKPVRELYPHPDFLAACRARDVPVTLASDAHSPDVVGRDFDRALELLRAAGYETVTVFEQRRGRQEPLG